MFSVDSLSYMYQLGAIIILNCNDNSSNILLSNHKGGFKYGYFVSYINCFTYFSLLSLLAFSSVFKFFLCVFSGIFWAEHFEFTPTPGIQDVTVHLYKDSDKKKKKDKDYMGLVNLSVHSLRNQQSVEKW